MEFDDDLLAVIKRVSRGYVTEAEIQRELLRTILELQHIRKVLKVSRNLDPQAFKVDMSKTADSYLKDPNMYTMKYPGPPTVAEQWFENRKEPTMGQAYDELRKQKANEGK